MNKELENILSIINNLKYEIKQDYKTDIIGVFGSYARGDQKTTSDLDILVRFDNGATLLDFGGLSVFLEEKLGLKVDIVPVDVIRNEIKDEILKEALYI